MIKTIKYNLTNGLILTTEVLNSYILKFWNEIFASIIEADHPKHLMIICKVKYGVTLDSKVTLSISIVTKLFTNFLSGDTLVNGCLSMQVILF